MDLISDHMLLRYGRWTCHSVTNANESRNHETNILLKFKIKTHHGESNIVIKECGVLPLYASMYRNSVEQRELEEYLNKELKPESWESTIEIEAGNFDGNKQQKETLLPIHKTFLPVPTSIWKEGTSGLKELLKF